jgi:hypothetical protein
MIPELRDGVLPEGIHLCTLEEVKEIFGQFRGSDRRPQLTERLTRYVQDARSSGVVSAIVIDGSYVTAKEKPGDIDLIVALRPGLDLTTEMRPMEYNIQSKRWPESCMASMCCLPWTAAGPISVFWTFSPASNWMILTRRPVGRVRGC